MPKDMIWKARTASAHLSTGIRHHGSAGMNHRNGCQDTPRQIEGFSHPTSSHAKATSDPERGRQGIHQIVQVGCLLEDHSSWESKGTPPPVPY